MPSDYYFGYYIYAPNGRFEPCGMFTWGHIVATLVCLVLVAIALYFAQKNNSIVFRQKLVRGSAIVLTILESVKIAHSFIYGELHLDAWFPLSYCGLFIFALWMSGYGKSFIKRAGESFITYGCPVAGIAFLIFPTTSLMSFPIWHFFSMYSLFFHSLMIFIGILFLSKEEKLTKNAYLGYISFVLIFTVIAVTMNTAFGCNLMNLREPYNIPIAFLQNLYATFSPCYTLLVAYAYMIIPTLVSFLTRKLKIN